MEETVAVAQRPYLANVAELQAGSQNCMDKAIMRKTKKAISNRV